MRLSRRALLKHSAIATCAPLGAGLLSHSGATAVRCINVVNFIRGVEPREPMDLLLPVQKQMDVILQYKLPATWLLQFDALVDGPYVDLLKDRMAADHEVGFWFEMNEKLCDAAGVDWRGRPGYEWDYLPPVAFTIGYTEVERVKLADAAMAGFRRRLGRLPKSVASWNLDSITMAHLSDKYGVDAFAVCRDQVATDGFTIWGAPIAGYYPSTVNCWSPSLATENQIQTPVFRMLGQDPVYYYQGYYPMPGDRHVSPPDTMEPVWKAGQSAKFVEEFLGMIANAPCLKFAYAQLGQENSFGWPRMTPGYEAQMKALAALRATGAVHVETMGESGRRFKAAFRSTPAQAQVMLSDPFGNSEPGERTIWYQSRFYRANLHLKGELPFLRDLTVYSDEFPQPFLHSATRSNEVEQRAPAVLDGYHWRAHPGSADGALAGGFFSSGGRPFRLTGEPKVTEDDKSLIASLPVTGGVLNVRFSERDITATYSGTLELTFRWDPAKAALVSVEPNRVAFRWDGFDYGVDVAGGAAKQTAVGWSVSSSTGEIRLGLAQRE